MLARVMSGVAVHYLEEMPMQVDGVGHHRVVDERDTNPLIRAKRDRRFDVAELLSIERPHEPFHIAREMDLFRPRGRPWIGIGIERYQVAVNQHPVAGVLKTLAGLICSVLRHWRNALDTGAHLDLRGILGITHR